MPALAMAALLVATASLLQTSEPLHCQNHLAEDRGYALLGETQVGETQVSLLFGLTIPKEKAAVILSMAEARSDPFSDEYGAAVLTRHEVAALSSPSNETFTLVMNWLRRSAGDQVTAAAGNDFLTARLSVQQAERLLPGSRFARYLHRETKKVVVRSSLPPPEAIPGTVRKHIEAISGVCDFPLMRSRRRGRPHGVRSTSVADAVCSHGHGAPLLKHAGVDWHTDRIVFNVSVLVCCPANGGNSTNSMPLCSSGPDPDPVLAIEARVRAQARSAINVVTASLNGCKFSGAGTMSCVSSFELARGEGDDNGFAMFTPIGSFAVRMLHRSGISSPLVTWESPLVPLPVATPALVRQLYNISSLPTTSHRSTLALAEFDSQFYSPDDLRQFNRRFGLPDVEVALHGSNNAASPGGESTLDLQWATAVASSGSVATTFWHVDGGGFLLPWVVTALGFEPTQPSVREPKPFLAAAMRTKFARPG